MLPFYSLERAFGAIAISLRLGNPLAMSSKKVNAKNHGRIVSTLSAALLLSSVFLVAGVPLHALGASQTLNNVQVFVSTESQ